MRSLQRRASFFPKQLLNRPHLPAAVANLSAHFRFLSLYRYHSSPDPEDSLPLSSLVLTSLTTTWHTTSKLKTYNQRHISSNVRANMNTISSQTHSFADKRWTLILTYPQNVILDSIHSESSNQPGFWHIKNFTFKLRGKKSPLNFHQLQHVCLTTLAAQSTAAHSHNTRERVFFGQHAVLYTSLSTCKPGWFC